MAIAPETDTGARTERFHRPELDGLRFLAALAVFAFHALPNDVSLFVSRGVPRAAASLFVAFVEAGAAGVDFFFALSAFLITELLFRELERDGRLAYGSFLVRRALRIWPLYFVFLFVAARVLPHVMPLVPLPTEGLAAFAFFVGNWYCARNGFTASTIVNPLWSISIEEQFYVLWPLCVARLGARPASAARFAFGLVAFAVAARIVALVMGLDGDAVWCATFTRLDAIAAGVLTACLYRRRPVVHIRGAFAALVLGGVLAIVLGSAAIRASWAIVDALDVVAYVVVASGCASVLYGVLTGPPSVLRLLGWRPLAYLGRVSYGFYVFHVLGLAIADSLLSGLAGAAYVVAHAIAGFAATLALAVISYELLETPFLRLKRRFQRIASGG